MPFFKKKNQKFKASHLTDQWYWKVKIEAFTQKRNSIMNQKKKKTKIVQLTLGLVLKIDKNSMANSLVEILIYHTLTLFYYFKLFKIPLVIQPMHTKNICSILKKMAYSIFIKKITIRCLENHWLCGQLDRSIWKYCCFLDLLT